jgi:hypothetical protein
MSVEKIEIIEKPIAPTSKKFKENKIKNDLLGEYIIELNNKSKKFIKYLIELGGNIKKTNIPKIKEYIKNIKKENLIKIAKVLSFAGVGFFGIIVFVTAIKSINEELERRNEEK